MNKFKQLFYMRPNTKEIKEEYKTLIHDFKKADSYEKAKKIFLLEEELFRDVATNYMIASIRNNMNTKDEFYEGEINFFNRELPSLMLLVKKGGRALLKSKYRKDFDKEFGTYYTTKLKAEQKTMNNAVLLSVVKDNNLCTEYSKTAASCKTKFRGEECNFYGLLKHMQSVDREERKEAFLAWTRLYESVSHKLDDQYDKMVNVRVKIAKICGFENFIDYSYVNRGRLDYGPKDVAEFRKHVVNYIVPVCQKLREEQAKRLGIDKIKYYDESLMFKDGNAVPNGNKDYMVKTAQKMYRELSKETGEFFDFMVTNELFDLETRPDKHLGGYCTVLYKYNAPFIFSNFNGTSADVDVLTHEAGHAFEAYTALRNQPLIGYASSTSEINEIHSMAMEFFTYPWMDEFFGDNVDKYHYAHMAESLLSIPYMCCVDEFQHKIFENPKLTAKQRRKIWHELEKIYMPWRDYDGNEFLEEGGFWMQKQHIFLYPFYYIDYALAQICVYELFGRMKDDKETAWKDYYRLCRAGGSVGYLDLLKLANLSSPFEEETVKKAVEIILEDLNIGASNLG